MLHPQLGWLHAGQLWLAVMPECRLAPYDRVVLLQRRARERARVVRGDGDRDRLPHSRVVQVHTVWQRDGTFLAENWALDGDSLIWLSDGPAPGDVYVVEYDYRPVYWWISGDMREPRPIRDAEEQTPLRGILSLSPPQV
jgi:hypothetical protein